MSNEHSLRTMARPNVNITHYNMARYGNHNIHLYKTMKHNIIFIFVIKYALCEKIVINVAPACTTVA